MKLEDLEIDGARLITPDRIEDSRGFLSEAWRAGTVRHRGTDVQFVQDNHAYSPLKGTVRGLHFQLAPMAQGKLTRVTRGAIFIVAVDLRGSSPTYGRHVSAVLSWKNWTQLWVPGEFAHGYCTLEPETDVVYKVSAHFDPNLARGILWDDPGLGIRWPVGDATAIVSDRDRRQPRLSEISPPFP